MPDSDAFQWDLPSTPTLFNRHGECADAQQSDPAAHHASGERSQCPWPGVDDKFGIEETNEYVEQRSDSDQFENPRDSGWNREIICLRLARIGFSITEPQQRDEERRHDVQNQPEGEAESPVRKAVPVHKSGDHHEPGKGRDGEKSTRDTVPAFSESAVNK